MVFSAFGVRGRKHLRSLYRPHVEGRRIVLCFQTVGEVRFGALNANWGEARRQALEERISSAAIAVADDELTNVYAELKHRLRSSGHGLSDKQHDGDRWIAATAVLFNLPLICHDRIVVDMPGLKLIQVAMGSGEQG